MHRVFRSTTAPIRNRINRMRFGPAMASTVPSTARRCRLPETRSPPGASGPAAPSPAATGSPRHDGPRRSRSGASGSPAGDGRRTRTGAGSSTCHSRHGRTVPPGIRGEACPWRRSPAPAAAAESGAPPRTAQTAPSGSPPPSPGSPAAPAGTTSTGFPGISSGRTPSEVPGRGATLLGRSDPYVSGPVRRCAAPADPLDCDRNWLGGVRHSVTAPPNGSIRDVGPPRRVAGLRSCR